MTVSPFQEHLAPIKDIMMPWAVLTVILFVKFGESQPSTATNVILDAVSSSIINPAMLVPFPPLIDNPVQDRSDVINLGDSFFLSRLRQGDRNAFIHLHELQQSVDSPASMVHDLFQLLRQPPERRGSNFMGLLHTLAVARGLVPNTHAFTVRRAGERLSSSVPVPSNSLNVGLNLRQANDSSIRHPTRIQQQILDAMAKGHMSPNEEQRRNATGNIERVIETNPVVNSNEREPIGKLELSTNKTNISHQKNAWRNHNTSFETSTTKKNVKTNILKTAETEHKGENSSAIPGNFNTPVFGRFGHPLTNKTVNRSHFHSLSNKTVIDKVNGGFVVKMPKGVFINKRSVIIEDKSLNPGRLLEVDIFYNSSSSPNSDGTTKESNEKQFVLQEVGEIDLKPNDVSYQYVGDMNYTVTHPQYVIQKVGEVGLGNRRQFLMKMNGNFGDLEKTVLLQRTGTIDLLPAEVIRVHGNGFTRLLTREKVVIERLGFVTFLQATPFGTSHITGTINDLTVPVLRVEPMQTQMFLNNNVRDGLSNPQRFQSSAPVRKGTNDSGNVKTVLQYVGDLSKTGENVVPELREMNSLQETKVKQKHPTADGLANKPTSLSDLTQVVETVKDYQTKAKKGDLNRRRMELGSKGRLIAVVNLTLKDEYSSRSSDFT